MVTLGAIDNKSIIIKDLIEKDKVSLEKIAMQNGVDYYLGKQDILDHSFQKYTVNGVEYTDDNKSNNQIVHTYHKLLVDQKTGYIVGNPTAIVVDPETEGVSDILGANFQDKLNDWVIGASNQGVEFMHPYYDVKGLFKFTIISALELIPIYDANYEAEIVEMIRYYPVDFINSDGVTESRNRVEWWTANDVSYYIELEDRRYIPDPEVEEEQGHWSSINSSSKIKEQKSWGKVPFIALYNNSNQTTDLQPIKTQIDDYDFNVSDFSNNLADLQDAIWVLKGYEGTNLAEFQRNLKKFKAINVGEDGTVDAKLLEIPKEARDSLLDRNVQDIYTFGMGVNMRTDKFGDSPSGIALQFLFSNLVLKVKPLERKLQTALQELVWFVLQHLGKEAKVKFIFDYSMPINETEIIKNLEISDMPPEEYFAKHPYIQDYEAALEWKKKEDENIIDLSTNAE